MKPFQLFKVRQRFDRNGLDDPLASLREQLARLDELIRPQACVSIAVGSRGINNLAPIVREVSNYVRGHGAPVHRTREGKPWRRDS